MRQLPSIECTILRVWEVNAPEDVEEPIEWLLLTTVPTITLEDALLRVRWYTYRWLSEDYHKCLKTGCSIELRQFDHADDIKRLLGFMSPIAIRILQLRQFSRFNPQAPASQYIDPLMIFILCQLVSGLLAETLTMGQFWGAVAQLGGYLGRKSDGPAGWQTLWRGWHQLSNAYMGARLYRAWTAQQQFLALLTLNQKELNTS